MKNNLNKQTRSIIGDTMEELLQIVDNCNKKVNSYSKVVSWLTIATVVNLLLTFFYTAHAIIKP